MTPPRGRGARSHAPAAAPRGLFVHRAGMKLSRRPRAEQWAAKICAAHGRTVAAILEIGRLLRGAKTDLVHGEFGRLFTDDGGEGLVPYTRGTGERLMAIADHAVLSNAAHAPHLPPAWTTLYELTKIPALVLTNAIKDGVITPDMPRKVVAGLLPAGARLESESKPHVSGHTGDNEWYTPAPFLAAARAVMGAIDLDPATTPAANRVVGAAQVFTRATSGLERAWTRPDGAPARVWLNPPYGQPILAAFCDHLTREWHAGHVASACVLVNNATETHWFAGLAELAAAICFPTGRITFWHPDKAIAPPLQGQAVLYLGPDPAIFGAAFAPFGFIVRRAAA